jgi:hypothetical protein
MALQFIEVITNKEEHELPRWHVTPEARKFLETVETPFAVVVAVGASRGGKSYLLKRLSGNPKMFTPSASTMPKTMGLEISSEIVSIPGKGGVNILLMDSEGSNSPSGSRTTDSNIMALSLLFASLVILRTEGKIDSSSIDQFACAIQAAELLKTAGNANALVSTKPRLLWLLRDFELKLLDKDEKVITPNQYMDNSLQNFPETMKMVEEMFDTRTCYPMVPPCSKSRDTQEMKNTSPLFEEQMDFVKDRVFKQTPMKLFNGIELTGPTLLALADMLCENLSNGIVPNLQSAAESMRHMASMLARTKATDAFSRKLMAKLTTNPSLTFTDISLTRKILQQTLVTLAKQQQQQLTAEDITLVVNKCLETAQGFSDEKIGAWTDELKQASTSGNGFEDCGHLLPDVILTLVTNELQRLKQQHQDIVKTERNEIDMLTCNVTSLEQQLIEHKQQLQLVNSDLVKLQSDKDALETDYQQEVDLLRTNVLEAHAANEETLATFETDLRMVKNKLVEKEEDILSLQATVDSCTQNQTASDELEAITASFQQQQEEIEHLKARVESLDNEKLALMHICKQNKQKMQTAEVEAQRVLSKMETTKSNEIARLEKKDDELVKKNTELKSKLEESLKQIEVLSRQCAEITRKRKQDETQITTWQTKFAKSEKARESDLSKLERQKAEILELRKKPQVDFSVFQI